MFDFSLPDNPYFNAGAGLAVLGLAATVFRRGIVVANGIFRRKYLIAMQMNNLDPCYHMVLNFIGHRHIPRQIAVRSTLRPAESGKTVVNKTLQPAPGPYYFWYRSRLLQVDRQFERLTIEKDGVRTPFETVTITTLGTDVSFLSDLLLSDATSDSLPQMVTGIVFYRAIGPEWRQIGYPARKRPLSSVILDADSGESLVADMREFINSEKWYNDRGIPYRRGYLFYGPPGTGKSSFIVALAGYFDYGICELSLCDRTLDDDRLKHLLNTAPPESVIVLEDVDAAFGSRIDPLMNQKAFEGLSRVTLSGLLNAVDGMVDARQRILFMSTNYKERLDPALIRAGRIDMEQYFGYCNESIFEKFFASFYGSVADEEQSRVFASRAAALKGKISPAEVQQHLLRHKLDPQAAIDHVATMLKTPGN